MQTISTKPITIGFTKKYFPQKKDLLKNINLAIRVMNDYNDTNEIVKKYKKESLSIEDKKISAVIYPWGFLVSKKIDGYGILPEIVSSAFKERNITVEYKFRNWNYAYLLNKWGTDCLSFPWTKESDTNIYSHISEPLILSEISFFYLKNSFLNGIKYNDLYDMKNYRLGGLKGAFYEKFFGTMSFDYTSFKTVEDMLTALVLKKIDIIPINEYLFRDAVFKYMPHKINDFAMSKKPMVKKANYVLFSKKCEDSSFFRDEFNKGFDSIKAKGILDKILEKHSMTKDDKIEFESFFANMDKVEEADKVSIFDTNKSDINDTYLLDKNISNLNNK
jgi:polar amino acid transport system substrate-binding protein